MQRIVILNPKGGSGKTTISTNLAACYAANGLRPTLIDLDPQGSSIRWLRKRPYDAAPIHGIAGFEKSATVTRSWQQRIPPHCGAVVVDTPAAIDPLAMPELTRGADAVLVPVMPSEIDIHATAKCIADLLLVAKMRRSQRRIAIIANRVRNNTRVWQSLTRFLSSLDIPLITTLRDSQSYVRSFESGLGLLEMPRWQVQQDVPHWLEVLSWLSARPRSQPAAAPSPANVVAIGAGGSEPARSPLASVGGSVGAAAGDLAS
jgi:chromosome partitioning protein